MTTKTTPTFQQLRQRGFSDLVPIIPADGELSAGSKIEPSMRGKVPGRLNKSGKWSGFDFLKHEATEDDLAEWQDSGAGVGLICRSVIAVDIDVTDAFLSRAISNVAVKYLGDAPVRIGKAPKQLLLYRLDDEPLPGWRKHFTDATGEGHLLELLGHQQQFVVRGIHPVTRAPYTWDRDLLSCELPAVTAEQLARFMAEAEQMLEMIGCRDFRSGSSGSSTTDRATINQDRLHVDTEEDKALLAKAIEATPNDFPERDDYIRFGCAIKAAFADDEGLGLALFQDWAAKWEDGENDPETVERDWGRMHPPFELGANWLLEQARDRGFSDADADFDDVSEAAGGEVVPFWDHYVYVEPLERFVDMSPGSDRDMLSRTQFAVRYANVGKGISSKENAASTWLENMNKRTVVKAATYRPGDGRIVTESGKPAVNLWAPGPLHSGEWTGSADEYDVEPWLSLVKHLIPDERERNHLLDWMAFIIQNPGVKQNWHPLIGGDQGLGKDTILRPLVEGLGKNAVVVGADDINSPWTDWQANATLVLVGEMNSFVRKEISDKMKPLLASPPETLRINVKNVPQYFVPNIVNCVMFTNHEAAMSVSRSDRRVFVLWSEAEKWTDTQFTQLHKWLDNDGCRLACNWLKARDLSAHNAKGRAPDTQAKANMADASMTPLESLIHGEIELENGIFAKDLVSVREVMELVRSEGFKAISFQHIGAILRQAGGKRLGKALFSDGTRSWIWAIRRVSMYDSLKPSDARDHLEAQRKRMGGSAADDFM